jgi:enoyl-CoA hydratase
VTITRSLGEDGVARLHIDDGKVNAFDLPFFDELEARLDDCADDAAVVLIGREGVFSAGLNTKVLAGLDEVGLRELLETFGRAMLRAWLEPRPLIAAVTGHAIAGGTILAMTCDHAVAADGFRWGLTETTIGFPIPRFVLAIASGNVRADRLDDLVLPGRLVDTAEAVEAGYADVCCAPTEVVERAIAHAHRLAVLPRRAYAATKRRLRGAAAETALEGLADDIRALVADREPPR